MKKVMRKFLRQKKIFIIIEMLILLLIIASICLLILKKIPKLEKTDSQNQESEKTVEVKKVKIVNTESTSRPFAVMINNISTARPLQSGLQDAYIMYEMIVEGGITRYLALFLDTSTERIGSIRSARHYYLDYALENDAIYVHHGQSPQALSDFSTLDLDRVVVDNSKTGWRDKTLNVASEHTLFTSIEKLNNGTSKLRKEREKDLLLDYSVDELDLSQMENSTVANNVKITYSTSVTSSYVYDEINKVYKRFVNNKEHTDYVTKEQYTFKNIITYQVYNSTITGDLKGRQEFSNIGKGEGYYISDGYAVKINWSKECRECQTKYTYQDGKDIVVNDGNTFIQIQPKGESLIIE